MPDLVIQIRPATTTGKGVGRWKTWYRPEYPSEIAWWIRDIVPSARMRVLDGKRVIIPDTSVGAYKETHPRDEAARKFAFALDGLIRARTKGHGGEIYASKCIGEIAEALIALTSPPESN